MDEVARREGRVPRRPGSADARASSACGGSAKTRVRRRSMVDASRSWHDATTPVRRSPDPPRRSDERARGCEAAMPMLGVQIRRHSSTRRRLASSDLDLELPNPRRRRHGAPLLSVEVPPRGTLPDDCADRSPRVRSAIASAQRCVESGSNSASSVEVIRVRSMCMKSAAIRLTVGIRRPSRTAAPPSSAAPSR